MTRTSDIGQQAKDAVTDLGRQAKDAATSGARETAEAARDAAANRVEWAANAADAAAAEFNPDSYQTEALKQLADRVDGFAETLRATDLDTAVSKVNAFARENPGLFLAGAALAGFAASRFLKARDPEQRTAFNDDSDPWQMPVTASDGALS